MTLHLFSTANRQTLNEMNAMIDEGDTLLLIGDGCYLASQIKHSNSLALAHDMTIRNQTSHVIELITDSQWVELVASSNQVISWLD